MKSTLPSPVCDDCYRTNLFARKNLLEPLSKIIIYFSFGSAFRHLACPLAPSRLQSANSWVPDARESPTPTRKGRKKKWLMKVPGQTSNMRVSSRSQKFHQKKEREREDSWLVCEVRELRRGWAYKYRSRVHWISINVGLHSRRGRKSMFVGDDVSKKKKRRPFLRYGLMLESTTTRNKK